MSEDERHERRAFERWFTRHTGLSIGAKDRSEFGYWTQEPDTAWAAWCASRGRLMRAERKAGGK